MKLKAQRELQRTALEQTNSLALSAGHLIRARLARIP
jgi:hypothetical protein